MPDTVTNTLQRLLENKKIQLLLALALVLIALRLYSPPAAQPDTSLVNAARDTPVPGESTLSSLQAYRQTLEAQLAAHLSHIAGAGQVSVMITFAASGRTEFATDRGETRRSTQVAGAGETRETTNLEETLSVDTVLTQGGGRESGLEVRETMPEVQGVVVVASGARASRVREMLTEAAVTILALPPHRVTVLPGR